LPDWSQLGWTDRVPHTERTLLQLCVACMCISLGLITLAVLEYRILNI